MMLRKVENGLKAKKKCPEIENVKMIRKYNSEVQCLLCENRFKHKGALQMHKKVHQLIP